MRHDGTRQFFEMNDQGGFLQSIAEIPEPHAFSANVRLADATYPIIFEEHEHSQGLHRDNNMRAAIVHVIADAPPYRYW